MGDDKTGHDFEDKVKKADVVWAHGEKGGLADTEVKYEIVAKSEGDAKDIEASFKDYLKAVKDKIQESMKSEKDSKDSGDKETPREVRDFEKARMSMGRHAIQDASVARDGKSVTLSLKFLPGTDEKSAVEDYMKSRKKRLDGASKIVDAILAGDSVPKDALEDLGGKKLLEAIDAYKPGKKSDSSSASASTAPAYTPPPPSMGATPESVPGTGGFVVPSGGSYSSLPLNNGSSASEYTYTAPPETVLMNFLSVTSAAGWSCVQDSSATGLVYNCTQGTSSIGVLMSKNGPGQIVISVVARQ
jgi:hypothetical protein